MPFCSATLIAPKPKPPAYPKSLNSIGDHLRKARLDRGLLQREVGIRLGVDALTITNWERNRTTTAIQCIPRIIAFLGYTPWDGKTRTPGERLKMYRWTRGLSQAEMAELLGVDPGTLARREKGKGRKFR